MSYLFFVVVAFLFVCSDALANIVQNEYDCHTVVNIEFSFAVFLGEINNLLASRLAFIGVHCKEPSCRQRYGI